MAALVEILYSRGAYITGSDVSDYFYTDEILKKLAIPVKPFSSDNITGNIDYVIYSAAYNPLVNADLVAAINSGIPCMLYTEALGSLSEQSFSISVCGVHGKTTTTGLVGTVLADLDIPFQVLAGSVINSFGDSCTMTKFSEKKADCPPKYFIAETCEYQQHFMSFSPSKIILTSVESDHQDYYPTYADIRDAFVEFICKLPEKGQLIYCCDDAGAKEVAELVKGIRPDIHFTPYGTTTSGKYRITFGPAEAGKQVFKLDGWGNFALQVPGEHFVRNAAAAVAVTCSLLKKEKKSLTDLYRGSSYLELIKRALLNFTGGKRRSEIVGNTRNRNGDSVIFIDDYAHHPTAIRTTLAGYRKFYGGRKMIVDFMSHTYSRTQALLEDFASSFGCADLLVLHKIYSSAREKAADFSVTGKILYQKVREHTENCHYFEEVMDAHDFLYAELNNPAGEKFPDGILFVTMGAGDNWKIGKKLFEELCNDQHDGLCR
jgi:UDP-N-acetylmuramate--alanine ligase